MPTDPLDPSPNRHARRSTRASVTTFLVLLLSGASLSMPAPAVAREAVIDRAQVISRVQASSPTGAALRAMSRLQRAQVLGRCFALSSLTYCLGLGFQTSTPNYRRLAGAATSGSGGATGDLSFADWMTARARMSNAARAAAERAEIEAAWGGVSKVLEIRRLTAEATSRKAAGRQLDPPPQYLAANAIMAGKQTRQERSYWCGPATMQSIHWGSPHQPAKLSQATWASRLGTTTSGTAITEITKNINQYTTWDNPARAGKYVVESVTPHDANSFYWIHRAHLGTAGAAPIVEHPQLLYRFFSYLKFNHSGHFQVGRGYRTENGIQKILIFEVFNEKDYNASGNTTWGPRTVASRNLLEATKAHPMHNFGL